MIANKAFKYRMYPNAEQRAMLAKTFGCVRFVYNRMLADKIAYYKETGKMLNNTPAPLKAEYEWLGEVDSLALANAQMQLQAAYRNFFENKSVGFPKFRSKHGGRQSYTTNRVKDNIRLKDGKLRLPKIGFVRIKQHRAIPEEYIIKGVTVSREASGKYYASILTEYKYEPPVVKESAGAALGLDYSSPHFYVDSDGNTADMPHFYREAEKRLAREQRKLAKMVKGSNNYQKQKIRVAVAYEKVRFCRKDWQHKESKRLAESNNVIAVEDINYRDMAQGLHLAKATNDNGFGQFRGMLAYKMAERGKKLITIDKWFPSSKTCHVCGHKNDDLQLGEREWDCPNCGTHLQRDLNAAINIRNQGLAMIV